jgi:hypothetical protein
MTRGSYDGLRPGLQRTMGAMPAPRGSTWEYREITLPRGTARDAARAALVELAEHGSWELARLRLYPDGRRRVWLRRKVLRAVRSA